MLGDRLAHRLAQLGILRGEPQRAFRHADAARGDVDAAEFQAAGRLEKALAFDPADQVRRRNAIVLEDELGAVDALVAELVELLADR
jgi:hypothetical protein